MAAGVVGVGGIAGCHFAILDVELGTLRVGDRAQERVHVERPVVGLFFGEGGRRCEDEQSGDEVSHD
jgi:hypothetical protein